MWTEDILSSSDVLETWHYFIKLYTTVTATSSTFTSFEIVSSVHLCSASEEGEIEAQRGRMVC